MRRAPKSVRLHIGLFGRTNVGKSSFLNLISGQDVSITSSVPGTTTDVVEKTMELLPVGPVVFLDTGGLDDISALSELRLKRTRKIFDRSDVIALVIEPDVWGKYEDDIMDEAGARDTPVIIVVNKTDQTRPRDEFIEEIKTKTERLILCSSIDLKGRDRYVDPLKQYLIEVCPQDFLRPPPLIGDLIPSGGTALLIVPIDMEAPKGRIILPQAQTIRDALDNDAAVFVVKESGYARLLNNLKTPPDIVVCDSQVVLKMASETPGNIKCTTFSILFARNRGNLVDSARAAAVIETLRPGDKVLIAEACSHHPIEDDIGRVKIPAWLRQYVGGDLHIDVCSGRDYPEDITGYRLVVHCGACMITRRETLFRLQKAKIEGVPVTNYGVCISFMHGVLKRVLTPFPAALDAFETEMRGIKKEMMNNGCGIGRYKVLGRQ
ncbi:MAG: [FeFe] hydrogenase H-cluster maturation GTPase HydF [Candidatus Omnitrophota bacterium]|nr:[FeFe] hydrogenase H-cluster maturation GTPase HydF [Candidatus Omnitrophota bacterium]